jgi:hypothetical protein
VSRSGRYVPDERGERLTCLDRRGLIHDPIILERSPFMTPHLPKTDGRPGTDRPEITVALRLTAEWRAAAIGDRFRPFYYFLDMRQLPRRLA